MDGVIDSSMLCSQAAVERVLGDGAVTSIKIFNTIQSDNFSSGSAGWQINRLTGSAEFQDVVVRGTLNADDITTGTLDASVITVSNLDADQITSGSLSVDRIGANTVTPDKFATGETGSITITIGTGGKIQSTDVSPDLVLNGDGSAVFSNITVNGGSVQGDTVGTGIAAGNITTGTLNADRIAVGSLDADKITTGTITVTQMGANSVDTNELVAGAVEAGNINVSTLSAISADVGTITAGTITGTTITGGTIRTAASGERVQIDSTDKNRVKWFGLAGELGQLIGSGTGMQWLTDAFSISNKAGTTLFISGSATEILIGPTLRPSVIEAGFGSSGSPSYSFLTDDDTGMWRSGTDQLSFSTAGVNRWNFRSDGNVSSGSGTMGSIFIRANIAGTAGFPTYTFTSDDDTGIYRHTTNTIGFSTGATSRMRLDSSGIYLTMTGTAGNPAVRIGDDLNTGMYSTGTEISLASDGREQFTGSASATPDEVRILPAYDNSVASGDQTVGVTSTGLLRRQTSTLRNKENIKPADWLADIPLQPVEYDTKKPENYSDINEFESHHGYGLIAEEVAKALPDAANYGTDGRVDNYQDRAILAILVAKVNRLEERAA